MTFQFSKHYSLDEARALLPQIRKWLEHITSLRLQLAHCEQRLSGRVESGNDLGGEMVNRWIKTISELKTVLQEFESREILIKDLERGLVDFPALREGREIFLCWEKDDADIEHWHDLDGGYSGREPL